MARTLTKEPNTRYQRHFEMLEGEAGDNGTGFWRTGFFVNGRHSGMGYGSPNGNHRRDPDTL